MLKLKIIVKISLNNPRDWVSLISRITASYAIDVLQHKILNCKINDVKKVPHTIHSSTHSFIYPSMLFYSSLSGGFGYTLDRSAIWHRVNKERHTTAHTHIHTYRQSKSAVSLTPRIVCLVWTMRGCWNAKRKLTTCANHRATVLPLLHTIPSLFIFVLFYCLVKTFTWWHWLRWQPKTCWSSNAIVLHARSAARASTSTNSLSFCCTSPFLCCKVTR